MDKEITAASLNYATRVYLRDYFAASAVTGLADVMRTEVRAEQIAKMAYEIADAMLKERER